MYFYVLFTIAISFFSYQGSLTILSCLGSSFQTIAAFKKNDKQLRELMIVGTSFWLIHNYLSGSPIAVLMEIIFISINIAGYYRYYIKKQLDSLLYAQEETLIYNKFFARIMASLP